MKNITLTTCLAVFLSSVINNSAQSFNPGCIQFTNNSSASLKMKIVVKNPTLPNYSILKPQVVLNPNTSSNPQCYNWQQYSAPGNYPYIPTTGVNYVARLDLNELNEKFKGSFKYDSTNFESGGWAQITVTNGANADQLVVTITGYKADGITQLSNTTSTLNKKGHDSSKR